MNITLYPQNVVMNQQPNSDFINHLEQQFKARVIPYSCGRAALVYGLRALGLERMDEILVPPYLGQCVLSAITRTAFPTMTPSSRTKAIMVLHQFGYPQNKQAIEYVAQKNNWHIINNCAHTMFSSRQQMPVVQWGQFSIVSFSKLFQCILGGAIVSHQPVLSELLRSQSQPLRRQQQEHSDEAYNVLARSRKAKDTLQKRLAIDAVFGYLPELAAMPTKTLQSLPQSIQELTQDSCRRKELLEIVMFYFADKVAQCPQSGVVPFAIPVAGSASKLSALSRQVRDELGVHVPVLHFDFSCNMLQPNYQPALVIGCHQQWDKETIIKVCEILKKGHL